MSARSQHIIKSSLFGFIIVALSIPALQHCFEFGTTRELKGVVTKTDYKSISWNTWCSGYFQENTEEFLNSNFGFRDDFIRLNNQKHYWLYNSARANGVVIGKEGYLYEKKYILSFLGLDLMESEEIDEKTRKLKYIQEKLKESGTDLYVVFAPGKGSYCSEYIPNYWKKQAKSNTNYKSFLKAFKQSGINYLDFRSWFMEMKEDAPYPLFPKAGIHWSIYGQYLAADSLLKKVGEIRSIEVPRLILDKVNVEEKNRDGDFDIGEGMNLFYDPPSFPMGYPVFHIEKDPAIQQPKVLFIADSYFWGIYNLGLVRDVFGDGGFWYYNKTIYPDSYKKEITVQQIDIKAKSEINDVIIILCTESNLPQFAFGFIDELYNAYHN